MRNLSDDDSDDNASGAPEPEYDTVTDEATHWAELDKKIILEFRDDSGIVNEFVLVYHSFPLHFIASSRPPRNRLAPHA